MSETPFRYRENQIYGWPFYIARRILRGSADRLRASADALSGRERYPLPLFLKPLIPENQRLKNIHRGRRCFIIGNGPSLKSQDLVPLAGEITFAMNGFLNHPAIDRIRPTYCCLVDPVFFDGSASSERFLARFFENLRSSHFVVPCQAAARMARRRVPPDRRTFVSFAGNLATARLRSIDLTRPLPTITNSAQLAILIALYAGCSPIYLIGMDHDWLAHRGQDPHFYPHTTLENHPTAHGDCGKYSYRAILEDVLKVWRGYETLRAYAEKHGQQIINCTDGGFLDVFERATYEDIAREDITRQSIRAAA